MSKILKPTPEELAAILADHAKWLKGDGGQKADLSGADLSGANLSGANLSSANLRGAYLSGANLSGANLRGAYLSGADLSGANLRSAYLYGANLSSADLSGANLSGANLSSANLRGADLSSANLSGADLSGANLSGANLRGADLSSADLSGANLSSAYLSGALNAELAKAQTEIVPREGEFTAWKKCADGVLVKLLIPKDAERSNATGRKCRASKAVVMEIVSPEGTEPVQQAQSMYDLSFVYKLGEVVAPFYFHPDRFVECAGGIHFFLTREEAQAFSL